MLNVLLVLILIFVIIKLAFNDSKEKLNEILVGQLIMDSFQISSGFISDKELRNKIKSSDYETIEVNQRPYDIFGLPDDTLITANRADSNLTILNSSTYELVKIIDKIENKNFTPRGISFNYQRNNIYILDELNNQIIMTSLDFKKLESYGSYGSNEHQFDDPSSICFANGYLYVSDRNNERVQILTPDLEYSNTIALNYKPYMIKVTNKRICVTCVEKTNERGIYFYCTDSLNLKHKYDESVGKLSEINSCFYLLCCNSKNVFCFNTDGVLIKEISIERLGEYLIDLYDGNMIYFNHNLFITSYRNKKLLKF